MKTLRKDIIIENGQLKNIITEKNILQQANHPFLINMEYVFQTEYHVHFLMKFMRGGELMGHLRDIDRFTEEVSKFFIVQVILAIGHLHEQKIVYRDTKPENILLGEDAKHLD